MEAKTKIQDALKYIEESVVKIRASLISDKAKRKMSKQVKEYFDYINSFYYDINDKNEREVLGDKPADCGAVPIIYEYFNILTDNGNSFPRESDKLQCYKIIINVCWNYSDLSAKFTMQLCENGFVSRMLSIMKKFQHNFSKEEATRHAVRSALGVLHNCSKTNQNKKYFNKEPDMVDILLWYAKYSSKKLTSYTLLGECLENPDHRAQEFSAIELLHGLTRLANNKDNSAIIVKNGILVYIRLILEEGNETEKVAAAEAVWILAFCDKNKKIILADRVIISALKAASQLMKTEPSKLQLAAAWALWVLNQKDGNITQPGQEQQKKPKSTETVSIENKDARKDIIPSVEPSKHIMISYQWDCQDRMIKVKDMLEAEDYRVWIDLEEMRGSTLQAMAKAVENAAVVLISMSQKYKESKSCRTEAEYAYKRDVPVIPLKVEDNYVPDGWLGAIVGTSLYYKFINLSNFNKVFKELTKEIGNRGKKTHSSNVTVVDAPPLFSRKSPGSKSSSIKDWTRMNVESWAQAKNIKTLATESLDGEVLLFLKKLQREAPEFFYRCSSDQLGLKNIRQLMKFSKAVEELQ